MKMEKKAEQISLDKLKGVCGGFMTEESEMFLDTTVNSLRKKYKSKEKVIDYVKKNYDELLGSQKGLKKKEVIKYIDSYWEFL